MKSRLAKKIIKASDFYELYSLECRGVRHKRYPYWFRRWVFRAGWMYASKGTKEKHRRVLYWLKSYDMRLDEAIHRLPKYTQALLDAVEAKRMEIKKLHKFKVISGKGLEYGENVVPAKNQNETQPHWYDEKFEELINIIN